MDQDFHHYGTYYAARIGGFAADDAGRVAKASNFIDFLHEGDYGGEWKLVAGPSVDDEEIAVLDHARFTFQSGRLSTGVAPEDGLWCSYHFTPGNYDHIAAPSTKSLHGPAVAGELPPFETRTVRQGIDAHAGPMLNRPQSALAHELLADAVKCATDADRLRDILAVSLGGDHLLGLGDPDIVRRFALQLLGVRAHVIADTWAHQDFSGIDHEINTYYDVRNEWGRQAILYQDIDDEWHNVVLSAFRHENLQAVPNGTSYLGHGWMGHFPDYSFVRFRYKPTWRDSAAEPIERNNPEQYRHAFLELCSLMSQANGAVFEPKAHEATLRSAHSAIDAPCEIADSDICPRAFSADRWVAAMADELGSPEPADMIDAQQEPHPNVVLPGMLDRPSFPQRLLGLGESTVDITSDLYLFQIAADYHFHFVKDFLSRNHIREYTGRWSQRQGPISAAVADVL